MNIIMSFWVAALVALLSDVPSSNAHWTTSRSTPHPQISFVPIYASPKYNIARRYNARRSNAKTSLFALDVNAIKGSNEKGEVSLKALSSPKKGVKKSTSKISRSKKKVKGRIKQHAKKKALPKNKKQSKKKINIKAASPTKINEKEVLSSEEGISSDGIIYIQFSRVFQRHVVYQRHSGIDIGTATDKVIQSFEFLDDAVRSFPEAKQVLAPKDLPFPPPSCALVYPDEKNNKGLLVSRGRLIDSDIEEEECETTIAGMGLWTLCELEYDNDHDGLTDHNVNSSGKDDQHQQACDALRTLLQLVSSESSFTLSLIHI